MIDEIFEYDFGAPDLLRMLIRLFKAKSNFSFASNFCCENNLVD